MADRVTRKRKLSETDIVAEGISNMQIPDNDIGMEMDNTNTEADGMGDDDMEDDGMEMSDDDLELITDAKLGPATTTHEAAEAATNTSCHLVLNPRGATVLIRLCFNNKFATPPFAAPAHNAFNMWQFLEIAQQKMPWLNFENSLDGSGLKILAEPVFFLQETSFNTQLMRCSRWITTLYNRDGTPYFHWYRRNIQRGQDDVFKIEVRLRTDGKVENHEMFRRAGNGEVALNNQGYFPLNIERNDFLEIWELLTNNVSDPTCIPPARSEPGTATYFPERRHAPSTVDRQGNTPDDMVVAPPQEGTPAPPSGPGDAWMPNENMAFDDEWRAALDEANFGI